MEARQDKKNLRAGHKRELQQLREDLQTTRDQDKKARDESYRQVRRKGRKVIRQLEETSRDLSIVTEEKNELAKAVTKGRVRVEGLQKVGLAWRGSHDELQGKMKGKGEMLTCIEGTLVVQSRQLERNNRQIAALKRKHEDLVDTVGMRDHVIAAHASILGQLRGKHEVKTAKQKARSNKKRQALVEAGIEGRKEFVQAKAAQEARARFRAKTRQDKKRQE
jgi:hypothetical protein